MSKISINVRRSIRIEGMKVVYFDKMGTSV